jgi:hypothetical protein
LRQFRVGHFLARCVRFQSPVKLVGIAPSTIGTQNVFGRECFYPRERFTLEPANTLRLFVCNGYLPWGQALRTYGSRENIDSIPHVVVCCQHEQETNQYSLKRRSAEIDRTVVKTSGDQPVRSFRASYSNFSQARGDPYPCPKQGTRLISPGLKPRGFTPRFDKCGC